MFKGRLPKQTRSVQDRLFKFVADAREKIRSLPVGPERDKLLDKVKQAEAAVKIDAWANSPGLQPPKE